MHEKYEFCAAFKNYSSYATMGMEQKYNYFILKSSDYLIEKRRFSDKITIKNIKLL